MAALKPTFGTPLVRGHALAPRYGCWLLNSGAAREWDSRDPRVSVPLQSGVTRKLTPWGMAIDCTTNAGLYPIDNLRTPSGTEDNNTCLVARVYPRSTTGFRSIYTNNSGGVYIASGKVQLYPQTASTGSVSANTWTTIGVQVREGTDTDYYINGRLDSTIGSGTVSFLGTLNVGIGNNGINEYFDGLIDYVYLFTRTLTPAEHWALHLDPFQAFLQPEEIDAHGDLMVGTFATPSSGFNALLIAP